MLNYLIQLQILHVFLLMDSILLKEMSCPSIIIKSIMLFFRYIFNFKMKIFGIFHRKQVKGFMWFFSFILLCSFFQWFYVGGDKCIFAQFATFGLKEWKKTYVFLLQLLQLSLVLCIRRLKHL